MINYYEVLDLEQTASLDAIQKRLDDQYAKWRALVTNHDPDVSSQATKAIQTIEIAREILTNPVKRHAYDRDLREELETVAGLMDPSQIVNQPKQGGYSMVIPTRPITQQVVVEQPVTLNTWICSSCQSPNHKGTTYCSKCGGVVGQNCPNCNNLVEFTEKFCSSCGVNKEAHFMDVKRKKIQDIEAQISALGNAIMMGEQNPAQYAKIHGVERYKNGCLSVVIIGGIATLGMNLFRPYSDAGTVIAFILYVGLGLLVNYGWIRSRTNKAVRERLESLKAQQKQLHNDLAQAKLMDYGPRKTW